MSPSQTENISLSNPLNRAQGLHQPVTDAADPGNNTHSDQPAFATEPIPDGVSGWLVVFACSIHTFWINGWTGSWGIIQVALLKTTLQHSSPSTLSFVGSLGIAMGLALGVVAIRIVRTIGARWASLIGILLYGIGNILSGFAVSNVGGLFATSGVMYGLSSGLMYAMSNILPIQWFTSRLGTANGIIKLGGGVGATVMAVVTGTLTERVGIAWTFRIIGIASLVTGIPAAFMMKERAASHQSYTIDWALFRDAPFSCLFTSGAIGVFAIYTPSFFLPYVTNILGLSNQTSTGVIACFNVGMTLGRLISGVACDKFGAMRMLLLTMALNTVTFFAIWSVSSTLEILLVFSILNGIANGAFFVTLPTAVSRHLRDSRATGGISLTLTGWGPGSLVGNPIAGFLIDATGADKATSIVPFRPVAFYAGGTALVSTAFIVTGRLMMNKTLVT